MCQDALDQGSWDAVDEIVEEWRRERPDLDTSAKEITGRIVRLTGIFQQAWADALAPLGVTDSDFGILAPLRRAGAPHQLTPTELARHKMMTSGGMTAALDRLERKGLLTRVPNPADRRGSLVQLTDDGLRVVDEAMVLHTEVEHAMVGGLSEREREHLVVLLKTLLHAVEPAQG